MMKIFRVVLLGMLGFQVSIAAYAQDGACASDMNLSQNVCFSSGCQDVYPITQPVGCFIDTDCLFWPRVFTNCCGTNYAYNVGWTNYCLFALLKDKDTQTALLELAKKEEILIPSCSGAYVPFEIVREKLGTR